MILLPVMMLAHPDYTERLAESIAKDREELISCVLELTEARYEMRMLLAKRQRSFTACMTGPHMCEGRTPPICEVFDADRDGDVDLRDWAYGR